MTSWDQAIAPMKIDMNRRNYHISSFRSNTSSYISPIIYIYIIIIIIYIYALMTIFWYKKESPHGHANTLINCWSPWELHQRHPPALGKSTTSKWHLFQNLCLIYCLMDWFPSIILNLTCSFFCSYFWRLIPLINFDVP